MSRKKIKNLKLIQIYRYIQFYFGIITVLVRLKRIVYNVQFENSEII